MNYADFPWRPLGRLLVEAGFLSEADLEEALVQQRRSGRRLGEILVACGYLTANSLGRALAEQHGVELRPDTGRGAERGAGRECPGHGDAPRRPGSISPEPEGPQSWEWRPLGRLLLERGFLSEADLEEALAEQRRSGRRLGEILVECNYLTGYSLGRALAEQHGVQLEAGDGGGVGLRAVIKPPAPEESVYEVREVVYEPRYELQSLYSTVNFLEAADFAFEFLEAHEPAAVEIERARGEEREVVWTYSESRARAEAFSRKGLVETFGFDPTRWTAADRFRPEGDKSTQAGD